MIHKVFENLLTGNEEEVYADSAYASQATNDLLKKQSITNKVLKRAYRNKRGMSIQLAMT